jgi:LacI family transcriptional regulator
LAVETSGGAGRDMLRGIARYAREHGRWSMYHQPGSVKESVAWVLRQARLRRFDGVIARIESAHVARLFARLPMPVVDILGEGGSDRPVVHVDNKAIGHLAAEHLLSRGFRSLAYCGSRRFDWGRGRGDAFAARTRRTAVSYRVFEWPLIREPKAYDLHLRRLRRWIDWLPKPAGIFAATDILGRRILEACSRSRWEVPDAVAVIGVDNDETLCELAAPPLSSVDANHVGVGYEAARLLARLMKGAPAPTSRLLVEPIGLVARASTEKWAVPDADVARALGMMYTGTSPVLHVADVLRRLPMSRRTLERRFQGTVGRSIYDEILRARVLRAQELLSSTAWSIKRIALETGFAYPEHFAAVFKGRVGRSPTGYRRSIHFGEGKARP